MYALRNRSIRLLGFNGIGPVRCKSNVGDLNMFPEYKEAQRYEKSGEFGKALPLYGRVLEVVDSFGASSPMALHATFKMANLMRCSGNFNGAVELLSKKALSGSISDKVQCQQLTVFNFLASNNKETLKAAEKSVDQVEALEGSDWDISLFSASYSALGLAHLVEGNTSDAEGYLQMAARWAQTPLQQLIALSNLGTVNLYALNASNSDPSWNVLHRREHSFKSEQYKPVEVNSEKVPQLLKDALSYWEEGLRDAQKSVLTTAPSWCGPGGSEENLGMTGLGSKVLSVTNNNTNNTAKEQLGSAGSLQTLEERLTDVHYAVAYANLLCNLAEASDASGDNVKRDEYIASALKSLESHNDHALSYPTLGRVLSHAASAHFNATHVVTAEGLFRSAKEKLLSPYGLHDTRYLYESLVNQGCYGKMLKKWDKRESEGEKEVLSASKSIDKMRGERVLTSPFLQYPL